MLLAVIVIWADRGPQGRRRVVAGGSILYVVYTTWMCLAILTSESSPAGLGFCTLPIAQWAIVIVTAMATAVTSNYWGPTRSGPQRSEATRSDGGRAEPGS